MFLTALEKTIREYEADKTELGADIYKRLSRITKILAKCDKEEYYYAEMVANEFCQIINAIKEQNHIIQTNYAREIQSTSSTNNLQGFVACPADQKIYKNQIELLDAFYAFLIEMGKEPVTAKDYVARNKTFANRYLSELTNQDTLTVNDEVVFTYDNLEYILATFNTKDETGAPIKQKVNIRSALRMLNQFKHKESIEW